MSQPPLDPTDAAVEAFLTRWKGSGGSERASFQPYMSELCHLRSIPVFDAYGWPHDLDDESILQRLVDLNAGRAEEERRGLIRWLRPEYQNPQGTAAATNRKLDLPADAADDEAEAAPAAITTAVPAWPKLLPERFQAVQKALRATRPQQLDELARQWKGCKREDLQETLATLQVLAKARGVEGGWVVG